MKNKQQIGAPSKWILFKYPRLASIACVFVATVLALHSHIAFAADYYRWVDEKGGIHYGSTPPAGIKADKIKSAGTTATKPSTKVGRPRGTSPVVDQQKQAVSIRKLQCKQEADRLKTLQKSGTRIRMQQADGSMKYLSPEEVSGEIEESRKFIKDACK